MPLTAIPRLPAIPTELRLAAKSGRLTPFIGAGVSMLAGCPSWDGFAEGMLGQLITAEHLTHGQAQQIRERALSPRLKLSFIRNLARQAKQSLDYKSILHDGDLGNSDGRKLYRSLGQMAKSFVTTNYDYWLDTDLATADATSTSPNATPATMDVARPHIIHKKADISFERLMQPGTVIHLHGSLREPDDMIVTTNDYLNFYQSVPSPKGEQNNVLPFLRSLFNERVVLFIGYGMGDLELLEYVILKGQSPGTEKRHFMLQPFFSHELEIAKLYEQYYSEDCGITMLPYLRDFQNHRQLIEVLADFASNLSDGNLMALERRHQMESMLDGA